MVECADVGEPSKRYLYTLVSCITSSNGGGVVTVLLELKKHDHNTMSKLLSSDAMTDPVQSVGSHRAGTCSFMVVTVLCHASARSSCFNVQ